jgi:hypothetical protein
MEKARNPYSFDEALARAGLPAWSTTAHLPDDHPLREQTHLAWLLVSALRTHVGVSEAALLAAADGQYEALAAARTLGGLAAALAFLAPYMEKLGAAQERPHGEEHVAGVR